jgi:starvation-inducible DNA-binding protein
MKKLQDTLKSLLADVFLFYLKAHGYHWNVEGPDFSEYHGLFESIYSDAYGSIDPIAENIRKLDEAAPFRLERLAKLAKIDDKASSANTAKALAKDLLSHNDKLIEQLKKAFDVANEENEQGIANFLAERIDMHQKWSWQLRASTK